MHTRNNSRNSALCLLSIHHHPARMNDLDQLLGDKVRVRQLEINRYVTKWKNCMGSECSYLIFDISKMNISWTGMMAAACVWDTFYIFLKNRLINMNVSLGRTQEK